MHSAFVVPSAVIKSNFLLIPPITWKLRRSRSKSSKRIIFPHYALVALIISEVPSASNTMTDQLTKYKKYARFIQCLLLASGIWPCTIKQKAIRSLYRLVPVLAIICCIGISYGLQQFCRVHINNMGMLTKSLSLLVSISLIGIKVVLFLIYQRKLREMIDILRYLLKDALPNPHLWPIVFSNFHLFYYSAYMIFYTVFILCMTYSISPYILILYQHVKNIVPKRCIFPYPTSFPWPMEECGLLYKFLTVFETITSWFLITVTSGVDTFFGYCMFQISAVLRVMSHEFENLRSENCEYVMRKCVDRHNQLLRCRDILQDAFSAIVLYMTATNALIMCAVIFQGYQMKMTIVSGALFFSYILLKLSQTFSYAWYGSIVTSESESFRKAVYSSNWQIFGNKAFMRGVLIIMSQKPMTISAYNFFPISMELFSGILNTTISYFFLLKTVDESNDANSPKLL